jgi:hypothetical protein
VRLIQTPCPHVSDESTGGIGYGRGAAMARHTEEEARQRALRFDPARVGALEAGGWEAYYARRWGRMALLLFRLVRGQLGLPPLAALRAVRHGARAAIAFAPVKNDPETARTELRRFYAVAQRATGLPFDPDAAGDAELVYWVVHRAVVGQEDRAPLIDSLARIPAAVYGVPAERLLAGATERERAVWLVDRITGGQQASTAEAWREIAEALTRSYRLLQEEVRLAWSVGPGVAAVTAPGALDAPVAPAA